MRARRWTRAARRLTLAVALIALAVASAAARADDQQGTSATLSVALVPEQLGHGTTIAFGFALHGPHGGASLPPPVTTITLLYPEHFGLLTSGLGLADCTTAALETLGPNGCPSRSLMGYGTATGAVQVAGEVIDEEAVTAVFMAPFQTGEIALLFYLDALTPLLAERIFQGFLQPASPPYGGALTITVPIIEGLIGGPDVALVKLRSTIGPLGITYYERIHGKYVPYRPSGIVLPRRCPRSGFPFAARFTFADGQELTATKTVRCPSTR